MVSFVRKPQLVAKKSKGAVFWTEAFPGRKELPWSLGVLVITLLGFLLRLVYINQAAGYDETYTYLAFSTQPVIHIFTDYSYPNNHIFHTFLVNIVTHLIPLNAIWVMRLPSLLAGILLIPATYLAGRALYSAPAGVIASTLVAVSPLFINFSAEARGYTILSLMGVLMLWLAGQLVKRSHWTGWLVFSICGILGALTIPIMLYPLAAIYVWMVADAQITGETTESTKRSVLPVFLSAFVVLVGTLAVYSPVILFGTGYKSLVSNGFVAPLPWDVFLVDLMNRLETTWISWNKHTLPVLSTLVMVGFFLSFIFHHRLSPSRLHLALPTAASILAIVFLQQVAPMPRIWQFLQAWYFIWAGAGWMGLVSLVKSKRLRIIESLFVIIFAAASFADRIHVIYQEDLNTISLPGVEQSVAWILSDQIQQNELIVTVVPMSTQIKYYYNQVEDYLPRFYNSDLEQSFSQVLVVVNPKYDETLESVLKKNNLLDRVDLEQAVQTASYKQVTIYRLPILETP